MSRLAAKITSKNQISIPKEVRKILNLHQGDGVSFDIDGDRVVISKISKTDYEYLKSLGATAQEWNSPEDDEAFRDL